MPPVPYVTISIQLPKLSAANCQRGYRPRRTPGEKASARVFDASLVRWKPLPDQQPQPQPTRARRPKKYIELTGFSRLSAPLFSNCFFAPHAARKQESLGRFKCRARTQPALSVEATWRKGQLFIPPTPPPTHPSALQSRRTSPATE
jgi:hypothetical protein